ncbi:glutamine-rich protein 2 isoform X2 [Epinephelus lanceolatus]
MTLIQELHSQRDSMSEEMKEEMKELCHQQKMVGAGQVETLNNLEKCCHRVDALEDTVRSLRVTFQKYPDPEELSKCVTWDIMQSALLSDRENLQKELIKSEVVDPATYGPFNSNFTPVNSAPSHTSMPSSPHPVEDTSQRSAPSSPTIPGQILTDTQTATEAPSVLLGPPQQTHPKIGSMAAGTSLTRKAGSLECYSETVEALRDIGKLRERFSKLEARVAALEEGKVDQSQLTHLKELITNKVSQDVLNNLMDQLNQQRALIDSLMRDREKVELVNDVQKAILQLQAEFEKLHETARCLDEDSRQKQSHIEKLFRTTEKLEEKKADKQMVESEIKADKSALESKVSRLQFDSTTEHLNTMFHELLNKVTGQEQDWHKVIDKLSTEMECKLNRIELDSVKKQLEDRWKNIHEKLQAQGAPEHEDAAGIRKQLVDRFHCLSCDRPVVMHTSGQHLVKLPSTPGFPSHKSIRPFTVYALEQFRQHYRSERISEMTDYSHLAMSRSCGGSHTVTSASQRRTGLQYVKHHPQTEVDTVIQTEEVDIVGLDGHIYKGRLNAPAIRNTETKLPTISTKDGMCKTKDKAKCSLSHKPAASPELGHSVPVHHPNSAKSAQCSRSASSISGRDWPVSALGCTSQSSITPALAAAESNTEPHADEPLDP